MYINWKEHKTNDKLYGNLPKLLQKKNERRCRLAGDCKRHIEEEASKTILLGQQMEELIETGKWQLILICWKGTLDSTTTMTEMKDQNTWKACIEAVSQCCSHKKSVLQICSKVTAEHPCRSMFSIKLLCNWNNTSAWLCSISTKHFFGRFWRNASSFNKFIAKNRSWLSDPNWCIDIWILLRKKIVKKVNWKK